MSKTATAQDVASYMKTRLSEEQYLYQETVVYEIQEKFGESFVYDNESGNLAISQAVLAAFRKITPDVVWDRGERYWRQRENYDDPNSRTQG